MCHRELFKVDLDVNYSAICSSKEHVGSEPFGDDLTERLKTVKESKKEAQQITKQKIGKSLSLKGSHNFKGNFLFHCRGRFNHERCHRRGNYRYYQKEERNYRAAKSSKQPNQKLIH